MGKILEIFFTCGRLGWIVFQGEISYRDIWVMNVFKAVNSYFVLICLIFFDVACLFYLVD